MLEIFNWLRGDKNYFNGVLILKKYNPSHPLLKSLEAGASDNNRMYLHHILKKFYEDNENKEIQPKSEHLPSASEKYSDEVEEKKELTHADFYRIANKELAKAYQKRRDLSNELVKCKTDGERAIISDRIKTKISEIGDLKARINVYNETGEMPPKSSASQEFEIPNNEADLIKAISNFRSKISHQKSLIKNYEQQERRKSKAEHEYKLSELENHLQKLIDERNNRKG